MILAAGLGTRLRPLTDEIAKALVPVGDRSVLAHVAGALAAFERVCVNAHHRADEVERAARVLGLACSIEEELLGTAGGIQRARERDLVRGDVLVWNADILGAFDAKQLFENRRGAATLLAFPRPAGQGTIGVDANGRVVRLRDRVVGEEQGGGDFTGVHVVSGSLELPEKGCIVGDVYLPMLERGEIHVEYTDSDFIDVGSLHGYRAANRGWLEQRKIESFIGEGAKVACALERSVIGAGAEVEGEGALVRCIVWPGARARAPLEDAVVTLTRTIG